MHTAHSKMDSCAVSVVFLEKLSAERDRLEDENVRLVDRMGALQVRLQNEEELNRKLREANAALLQRLKQAGRSLHRESARLRRSIHMGEVSPAQAVVCILLSSLTLLERERDSEVL